MKYSTIILFLSLFCHSVISVCFPEESVLDCLTRKKAKETEKHQEKEDIEDDEVVTRGVRNFYIWQLNIEKCVIVEHEDILA